MGDIACQFDVLRPDEAGDEGGAANGDQDGVTGDRPGKIMGRRLRRLHGRARPRIG